MCWEGDGVPLFQCSKCGCVENTAVGNYWVPKSKGQPVTCSECHTGKWHGSFPKKAATGMLIDQSGHLWSKEQVESGSLPRHYRIVGTVP